MELIIHSDAKFSSVQRSLPGPLRHRADTIPRPYADGKTLLIKQVKPVPQMEPDLESRIEVPKIRQGPVGSAPTEIMSGSEETHGPGRF
jgi:hypothetical protein